MFSDFIGYLAAFCTTVAFVPQAIKVLKTKDTTSLSLSMYSMFTVGVFFWLIYGITKKDPAIIGANLITGALALTILTTKIKDVMAHKKMDRDK